MSFLNLDFTGVETRKRIPAGAGQKVVVLSAEVKQAQSGNQMLAIVFKDANDGVAYANFVLLPQSLWKLKIFLEAVLLIELTGALNNFNTQTIVGKSLLIDVVDEEYINNNGEPAIRSLVTDYKPLSVTDGLGIAPQPSTVPFQASPTPSVPPVPPMPQAAPVPPVAPTPVMPNPAPSVAPATPIYPGVVQAPIPPVAPGVVQTATVTPTPAPQPVPNPGVAPTPAPVPSGRPKLPWEH